MIWELEEAVELIQKLEGRVRPCNFHTCLGGSVLHKGFSNNDLDIFILPIDESDVIPDRMAILEVINDSFYGIHYPIMKASGYNNASRTVYEGQHEGRKVNIFLY